MTLNYDLNFVGILLSSLYEPTDKQYLIRCPLHPFHKKSVRTNQYMNYVSDMNIVLTYYKLEDDVLDENSLKSKTFKQLLKKEFNRIKKKYPDKVEKIKEHLDQIHYLEKSHCLDLDEVAGHFGHIMASICVYQEDVFKDDLYQMGFYLGKFIYHPDGTIYNFSLIGGDPELTLSDVTGPLTEEEFRALLPQGSTTAGTSEVTGTETTAAETAAAE